MTTEGRAPREDLIRMVPLTDARADVTEDGNTLVGMPIVFDTPTLIDSWEGRFRETVARGAVTKTLKEQSDRVKVLFNHGFDPQIGEKPLGKPRVMEPRAAGLWTETPLDDTSYNADLKALLRSGALDGMSFRFTVTDEEWDDDTADGVPLRTIKQLSLHEFGPVTWPAYEATTAGVRTAQQFRIWRKAEAAPPTDEGRSTDEVAAPETEGRDTSALDEVRKRIEELERGLAHEQEEIKQWAQPTS